MRRALAVKSLVLHPRAKNNLETFIRKVVSGTEATNKHPAGDSISLECGQESDFANDRVGYL